MARGLVACGVWLLACLETKAFVIRSHHAWHSASRALRPSTLPVPPALSRWSGVLLSAEQSAESSASATAQRTREDDWEQIVRALSHYKEMNGDLRVPSRFVVPKNAEDWPNDLRGLRLGIRVSSIRSTGRYVKNNPQRTQQLDDLGFEWRLRGSGARTRATRVTATGVMGDPANVEFEPMIAALKFYKDLNGDISVSSTYVVPDAPPWPMSCRGMPLGTCVNQIHTRGAYLNRVVVEGQVRQDLEEKRRKEVATMGDDGLSDSLSDEMLSAEVDKVLASRIVDLEKVGISVNKQQKKDEPASMVRRFERIFNALEVFRQQSGDLDVPQSFVVPAEAPWPEELHGLRLGSRVNAIRSQGTFVKNNAERRERLTELGFRWETEVGGRGKVKASESVSWSAHTPEEWKRLLFSEQGEDAPEDDLQALNRQSFTFDELVEALQLWNQAFDNFDIPRDFQLPRSDELSEIEIELDGLRKAAAEPIDGLEEFGDDLDFDLDEDDLDAELGMDLGSQDIATLLEGLNTEEVNEMEQEPDAGDALAAFLSSEGGLGGADPLQGLTDMRADDLADLVPLPDDEEGVDSDAIVAAAAAAAADAEQAARREEVKSKLRAKARIERAIESLEHKAKIYEIDWPKELGGLPMGVYVHKMRVGDAKGKQDPERRAKLDAIGFTWGDESKYLYFNFNHVVLALSRYRKFYGDLCVRADYTIPKAQPWPPGWEGAPLGEAVNIIRAQKDLLQHEYPDRYRMLCMMDFLWVPASFTDDEEENQARVRELTKHQAEYTDGEDWALKFYRSMTESEWEQMRDAYEQGFEMNEGERLFTLDDIYRVERDYPRDQEPDRLLIR